MVPDAGDASFNRMEASLTRVPLPALLVVALMVPAAAQAEDFHVTASSQRDSAAIGGCPATNPCTLKAALEAARTEGDVVHVGRGDYELSSVHGNEPVVRSGVTVVGEGAVRPRISLDGLTETLKTEASTVKVPTRLRHLELLASLDLEDNAIGTDLVVRITGGGEHRDQYYEWQPPSIPDDTKFAVTLRGGRLHQSLVVATGDADGGVQAERSDSYLTSSTVIATGEAVSAEIRFEDESPDLTCYPGEAPNDDFRFEVRNVIARGMPSPSGRPHSDLAATANHHPVYTYADCGVAWMVVSHSNFRTARGHQLGDKPWDAWDGYISQGEGNQTTSELTDDAAIFADTTMYRQRQGAPTRNAGTTSFPGLPTHDIDGQARVLEGGIDIGVDELPEPPVVSSPEAVDIGQGAATLRARVVPNATDTHVVFDYGVSDAYGRTTAPQVLPARGEASTVQARLEGLAAETTFHYRVRAYNPEDGLQPLAVSSGDSTFATPKSPPVVIAPPVIAPRVIPLPDALTALAAKKSVKLADFRKSGLVLGFTLGRPGTAYAVELTARLRVRGRLRTVTLAKARGTAPAGARTVTLKPSRRTAALLRRVKRLQAKLTVTALGESASRTVTLRR